MNSDQAELAPVVENLEAPVAVDEPKDKDEIPTPQIVVETPEQENNEEDDQAPLIQEDGPDGSRRMIPFTFPCSQRAIIITSVSLFCIMFIFAVIVMFHDELINIFNALLSWIQSMGPSGVIAFSILLFLTTIVFIPSFVLTIASGLLFSYFGILIVVCSVTLGSLFAFACGKFFLRRFWNESITVYQNKRIEAIDRALSKNAFRIILVFRLIPVTPFSFLNYFLGMTNVGFLPFFGATVLGMIPETIILVYLGTKAENIRDIVTGRAGFSWSFEIFTYLVSGCVVVAIFFYIVYLAKRELNGMMSPEEQLELNNHAILIDEGDDSEE